MAPNTSTTKNEITFTRSNSPDIPSVKVEQENPENTNDQPVPKLSDQDLKKLLQESKQEITELKLQLQNREARLMAFQDVLNAVLSQGHVDSSVLYKEVNKNLVKLADLVDATITNIIQQQITEINKLDTRQQTHLCMKFRQNEGLPPLVILNEAEGQTQQQQQQKS